MLSFFFVGRLRDCGLGGGCRPITDCWWVWLYVYCTYRRQRLYIVSIPIQFSLQKRRHYFECIQQIQKTKCENYFQNGWTKKKPNRIVSPPFFSYFIWSHLSDLGGVERVLTSHLCIWFEYYVVYTAIIHIYTHAHKTRSGHSSRKSCTPHM